MIKIEKLYSEPEIFEPIIFDYGINIIMGEKSETSNKKIGVGKSVCIEFINFCLLKKFSDSRLSFIPKTTFDTIFDIKLDLSFNSKKITIVRSIDTPEYVTIFKNGEEINFERLEDASDYLGNMYFEAYSANIQRISLRNLLAPIIRDERSEFKDLIQCYDTKKNIPLDYKPHLFFLGLGLELYSEIKNLVENLKRKATFFSEVKKLLTQNNEVKIQAQKARLNELESEVKKLYGAIEKLRNNESFELIQSELAKLQVQIDNYRKRQQAISYEIRQIDSMPKPENISENEISIIFNQFKKGLGDIVEKSLDELKVFKNRIDSFRNTIVNEKLESLKSELRELNISVRKLDAEYAEKLALIDNGDLLKDLKTSISVYEQKSRELSNLSSLIDRYDSAEREKKALDSRKTKLISDFDEELYQKQLIVTDFKNTILDIHENIMGNREAHFEIKTTTKNTIVEFNLRIDDDGSHTTERMKVFIYDLALMFNEFTKKNHPAFLIHDNIFEDDDSLEKSLNFLHQLNTNSPNEFQYIVTLNRDLIEALSLNNGLKFDVDSLKKATFTKDNRFLKVQYQEKK